MPKLADREGAAMRARRRISAAEQAGVPATDTTARSPHGVGKSYTIPGNIRALGRSERRRRRDREGAGIAPPRPIDPESPHLIVGDQGG